MSDNDNRFAGIEFSDDINVVPVVVAPEDPVRQIEIEDPTPVQAEPIRNFVIPRIPDAVTLAPVAPVTAPRTSAAVLETQIEVEGADASLYCGARIYLANFVPTTVDELTRRIAHLDSAMGFPRVASATEALGEAMKGVKVPLDGCNVVKGHHREKQRGAWALMRFRDDKDETPVSGEEWASIKVRDGQFDAKTHRTEIASVVAEIVTEATRVQGTVTASALCQWLQRIMAVQCDGITLRKNKNFAWVPQRHVATMEALGDALDGIVSVDVMPTVANVALQRQATQGLAEEADEVLTEIRTAVQGHSVGEEITEKKARGITGRADALCKRLEAMGRLFPSALNGVRAIREAVKSMDGLVGYSRASGLDV